MVLNQEKTKESIKFNDKPTGYLFCNQCEGYYTLKEYEKPEDFEKCSCGNTLEYIETLVEADDINLDFSEDIPKKDISQRVSLMSRLISQAPSRDELLTTIRQDRGNLWDSLNQFRSTEEHTSQKLMMDDVIEINRLMMMVDQKRALEESNPSRLESISQRVGLIGFLSGAIILLITVLTLTLLGEMV